MEASIGVNLRVTAHSNQGGRKYMEDMFCVAYQPTSDERDLLYAYFGIFDGHGGREAAMYAKQHLMDHIVSQKNFWSDDDEMVTKAIRDGFVATHQAMWKELENWPKTASGLPSTSGTTASIVFVRRGKMYIGHVGDSAIVLGMQDPELDTWRAKPLTRDHKPESAAENARITQCGGKVVSKSGVPRVVWNRPRLGHKGPVRRSTHIDEIPFLAVARSLGDLWSYNSVQDEFVVSPVPDVSVIDIDVKTHRCIVLGSDGLWNMLSAQDAVHSVYFAEKNNERQLLSSPPDVTSPQVKNWINPSKRLVDRALERWLNHNLRADNTSVVTVVIDPPGPPKAQVIRQNLNRTHVVRQSVSSVTDPTTSKTVPAMVLAPIPGQKLAQSSSFSGHTNPAGRGICTPVPSYSTASPESRMTSSLNDRYKMSRPSTSTGSFVKTPEKSRPSSSNDTKTRRILVKRKFDSRTGDQTREDGGQLLSDSNSVSCSSPCNILAESTKSEKNPAEGSSRERSICESSRNGETGNSNKNNQDDVQINEISSSSEAKTLNYSNSENPSPESVVKRRKLSGRDNCESKSLISERPLTRRSAILNVEKNTEKTKSSDAVTPLSTARSSRGIPSSAPTMLVKDRTKRNFASRPSRVSVTEGRSVPHPSTRSKSISPTFGEYGRSLRSCAKTSIRVTRSMKK